MTERIDRQTEQSAELVVIGEQLAKFNVYMRDYFQPKLLEEAKKSKRPIMGVGFYDTLDSHGQPITFVRTSPSAERFENRVIFKSPEGAENIEYRWSASDPTGSAGDFNVDDIIVLREAMFVLREEKLLPIMQDPRVGHAVLFDAFPGLGKEIDEVALIKEIQADYGVDEETALEVLQRAKAKFERLQDDGY